MTELRVATEVARCLAVAKAKHDADLKRAVRELEVEHDAKAKELHDQIQHMATQLLSHEQVVQKASKLLAKSGKKIDHLSLTDIDYTTLENVSTLRKKSKDLEATASNMKNQLEQLKAAKYRSDQQAKSWKAKMVQQLHTHELQKKKFEAEITKLRSRVDSLEDQIMNGGADDGGLKAEILNKLRADSQRLALADAKRHSDREKYLQKFYEEKLAKDLIDAKEQYSLKLQRLNDEWEERFRQCEAKHVQELTTQADIWAKRVKVVEKGIMALQIPSFAEQAFATQTLLINSTQATGKTENSAKLPPL